MELLDKLTPSFCEAVSKLQPTALNQAIGTLTTIHPTHLFQIIQRSGQQLNTENVNALFEKAKELHGGDVKLATGVVIVISLIAFPASASAMILNPLGFSAIGPIAGSVASGVMSKFGTFKLFSICQSAAMGGYGAPIVHGVIQGAATLIGAANLGSITISDRTQGTVP